MNAEAIAKQLPEVGEAIHAELVELSRDPTPYGCERMAARADALKRHLDAMRTALLLQRAA